MVPEKNFINMSKSTYTNRYLYTFKSSLQPIALVFQAVEPSLMGCLSSTMEWGNISNPRLDDIWYSDPTFKVEFSKKDALLVHFSYSSGGYNKWLNIFNSWKDFHFWSKIGYVILSSIFWWVTFYAVVLKKIYEHVLYILNSLVLCST